MIHALTHQDLRPLLDERESPCISLYVPLSPRPDQRHANHLQLRAAVDEARALLTSAPADEEAVSDHLDALTALVDDETIAGLTGRHGLAWIRTADGLTRTFALAEAPHRRVVVGATPHTLPLVRALGRADDAFLLGLSASRAVLWHLDPEGLRAVELPGWPEEPSDVIGHVETQREQNAHTVGTGTAVRHGHDDRDRARREADQLRWLRALDACIATTLESPSPLLLAGTPDIVAAWRQARRQAPEDAGTIAGNPFALAPDDLRRRAHEVLDDVRRSRDLALAERFETASGRGKAAHALEEVASLAVQGRVRTLLAAEGRHVWGHLDLSRGTVEVVDEGDADPHGRVVDLIDEVGEEVLRRGGEVHVIPAGRMPVSTPLAAVLR